MSPVPIPLVFDLFFMVFAEMDNCSNAISNTAFLSFGETLLAASANARAAKCCTSQGSGPMGSGPVNPPWVLYHHHGSKIS